MLFVGKSSLLILLSCEFVTNITPVILYASNIKNLFVLEGFIILFHVDQISKIRGDDSHKQDRYCWLSVLFLKINFSCSAMEQQKKKKIDKVSIQNKQ